MEIFYPTKNIWIEIWQLGGRPLTVNYDGKILKPNGHRGLKSEPTLVMFSMKDITFFAIKDVSWEGKVKRGRFLRFSLLGIHYNRPHSCLAANELKVESGDSLPRKERVRRTQYTHNTR